MQSPLSEPGEVIVLVHAECETPGTIEDAIVASGARLRLVRTHAGDVVPNEMASAQGLVIMGGPMGVYEQERFPFLKNELRLIERALAARLPILGVCLGSQLLAAALGAPVRKGIHKEIGWHRVFLELAAVDDPLFHHLPFWFDAFHWHGDVFDLPEGAVRLARSALTECQAFRYCEDAWGLLFHLEVTSTMIAGMIEAFADELHNEGIDPAAITGQTRGGLAGIQNLRTGVFRDWAQRLSQT